MVEGSQKLATPRLEPLLNHFEGFLGGEPHHTYSGVGEKQKNRDSAGVGEAGELGGAGEAESESI